MAKTALRGGAGPRRDPNRFSPRDDAPAGTVVLGRSAARLAKAAGIPLAAARAATRAAAGRRLASPAALREAGLTRAQAERVQRNALLPGDARLAILEVAPAQGRLFSHRPFKLRVRFAATPGHPPVLASVAVRWDGEPFTVERRLRPADLRAGRVDLAFGARQTLPVGPVAFEVSLFGATGARARFTTTCAVLPSNPFSLRLAPRDAYLTGSGGACATRAGTGFDVHVTLTLANGNPYPVRTDRFTHLRIWDGGVGGQLVESHSLHHGTYLVPALGTWEGWLHLHAPPGSPLFGKLNARADVTLEVEMGRADGGAPVRASLVARTMFRFGLNVVRVASDSWTPQELADLAAAGARVRSIFEHRDITVAFDPRRIPDARAGGFASIGSDQEAFDLCDQWNGDSNDFIDAFIVPRVTADWDGISPLPGPTSHRGPDSGIVCDRQSHTDSSGTRRLDSDYLAVVIAHEAAHYLGIDHVKTPGNLMLPDGDSSDTNLTYPQYRVLIRHGWMFIA